MATKGIPAGQKIPVDDVAELEAWARTLGLSSGELRLAVERAGADIASVRAYLNWNYQPIRSARHA